MDNPEDEREDVSYIANFIEALEKTEKEINERIDEHGVLTIEL